MKQPVEQVELPFDYVTFITVGSVIRNLQNQPAMKNAGPEPADAITYQVTKMMLEGCGFNVNPKAINYCIAFYKDRAYTYRNRSVLDKQIEALLDSPEYFPENINDYIEDVGTDELACYHNALLRFWQIYVCHVSARKIIFNLATVYGAMNNHAVTESSEYSCIYHRGMDITKVDLWVRLLVEAYDNAEQLLGFSPAHLPPIRKSEILTEDFVLTCDDHSRITSISVTTLVGRIWLMGSPKNADLGGFKIHTVD
ncbi:hypothetical protein NFI00_000196 [Salmonella enterica]|nr:hypothetical protein [Salmonella enterica]